MKHQEKRKAITLREYIKDEYYNNQRLFALCQDIKPQQVTQWINKEFIVVDDVLYSKRRKLNT